MEYYTLIDSITRQSVTLSNKLDLLSTPIEVPREVSLIRLPYDLLTCHVSGKFPLLLCGEGQRCAGSGEVAGSYLLIAYLLT